MRYLFFLPFVIICMAFGFRAKSPESAPDYHVSYIKPDPDLPIGTAQVIFTFSDENGPVKDSVRMSYNGIRKTVLPTGEGKVYLGVTGGKYKFQFFRDSQHFEISTDSIEIKGMHQVGISVWFTNSEFPVMAEKPVIYVYPDTTREVNIQLDVNGTLGFTYPAYHSGWNFTADPNGTIYMNDKTYDYLFWDGEIKTSLPSDQLQAGFIVQRDSLTTFFETKLSAMGLNAREQEDFITYWCPRMQENEKYFVHFIFNEAYDNAIASMNITPKPDQLFRVFMYWSTAESMNENEVAAQEIPSFQRRGFTVVEWGGGEISAQCTVTSAQ